MYDANTLAANGPYQNLKARLCASLNGAAYDTPEERDLRASLDAQMAVIRDELQGVNLDGRFTVAREGQPLPGAPRFNTRREAWDYLSVYPGAVDLYQVVDLRSATTVARAA